MFPVKYLPLKNVTKAYLAPFRTSSDVLSVIMLNKNLNRKGVEQNDTTRNHTRVNTLTSLSVH